MGRNEIRLRRQSMSSGRIAQHRNYGELMARHEKEIRIKRIIRLFIYFLIIAFMIVVFFMVSRIQEKEKPSRKTESALLHATEPCIKA
jgi:large-conductance mechanosensitive channel